MRSECLSDLLMADASHTFGDAMTTLLVIAGWQLSVWTVPWIDTVCAIGIAIFVAYLAIGLFRKAIPVLVDQAAIEPEQLIEMIKKTLSINL